MTSLLRINLIGGLALAALLLVSGRLAVAQTQDSAEINHLLSQAQTTATQLSDDAATLESYTRSRMSWESHARQLEVIRGHVNRLIDTSNKLSELRDQGSSWQQEAIDRIGPLMSSMADHLTASITHLQENPTRVHMQPYRDYARGNQVLADETLHVIRDFVRYGESKARAEDLEKKLALTQESGQ
jgi:hypothetical protein